MKDSSEAVWETQHSGKPWIGESKQEPSKQEELSIQNCNSHYTEKCNTLGKCSANITADGHVPKMNVE